MEEKVMIGGAKFKSTVLEWGKQSNHLFTAVASAFLLLYSVYAEKLSPSIRWQLSTTPGRLLLLLVLYIVHTIAGFLPALLFAIGIAITWANRPLYKPIQEGFTPDIKTIEVSPHKWFIERVLKENPSVIIEDRVDTRPVQNDTQYSNSRTSR
jgi:hypothetical protein